MVLNLKRGRTQSSDFASTVLGNNILDSRKGANLDATQLRGEICDYFKGSVLVFEQDIPQQSGLP